MWRTVVTARFASASSCQDRPAYNLGSGVRYRCLAHRRQESLLRSPSGEESVRAIVRVRPGLRLLPGVMPGCWEGVVRRHKRGGIGRGCGAGLEPETGDAWPLASNIKVRVLLERLECWTALNRSATRRWLRGQGDPRSHARTARLDARARGLPHLRRVPPVPQPAHDNS